MYLYYLLAAITGLVAGIIIAARSKKADGVLYGKLDKAGKITNVLLIPVYAILSCFFWFIAMVGLNPWGKGLMWLLSAVLAVIGATGPAFCGIGLGASVALRRKGKSRLSFWVQFAGIAGLGITFLFFLLFYGTLFKPLN